MRRIIEDALHNSDTGSNPAIVFCCETGKERTTTAMAIAGIIYSNIKVVVCRHIIRIFKPTGVRICFRETKFGIKIFRNWELNFRIYLSWNIRFYWPVILSILSRVKGPPQKCVSLNLPLLGLTSKVGYYVADYFTISNWLFHSIPQCKALHTLVSINSLLGLL